MSTVPRARLHKLQGVVVQPDRAGGGGEACWWCELPTERQETKNFSVGCFQFPGYFQLRSQFDSAGLSVFDNRWSEIHNFTPSTGTFVLMSLEEEANTSLKNLSAVRPQGGVWSSDIG